MQCKMLSSQLNCLTHLRKKYSNQCLADLILNPKNITIYMYWYPTLYLHGTVAPDSSGGDV